MFQIISVIISLLAIALSFYSLKWSWIVFAVAMILMLVQIYIVKVQYRAKSQPDISDI